MCIVVCVIAANVGHYLTLYLKERKIIGRRVPTEKIRNPQLYRMRIFAPDDVQAKSKFWYFMNRLKKVKKTSGEIVAISVVSM